MHVSQGLCLFLSICLFGCLTDLQIRLSVRSWHVMAHFFVLSSDISFFYFSSLHYLTLMVFCSRSKLKTDYVYCFQSESLTTRISRIESSQSTVSYLYLFSLCLVVVFQGNQWLKRLISKAIIQINSLTDMMTSLIRKFHDSFFCRINFSCLQV